MIRQIDSKNEWLLLSASFTTKFSLVLVLTLENALPWRFHLKERAWVLLKGGTKDFHNSPPFERSARFYVTISGNFGRFQYFKFETGFLENENLFPKTGVPFLR